MNRVLSFPQSHSCDDPSEAVSKRFCFSCTLSVAFISLILGYLLGSRRPPNVNYFIVKSEGDYLNMLNTVQFDNKSSDLASLTSAALNDHTEVTSVRDHFQMNKFDHISKIFSTKAVLTFRDESRPDTIEIIGDGLHYRYRKDVQYPYTIPPEAEEIKKLSSNISGLPVYGNFGTEDDFIYISQRNISVQDRIVVLRLGLISTYEKVSRALKRGAKAVLLFADPQQYPKVNDDATQEEEDLSPLFLTKLKTFQGSPSYGSDTNDNIVVQVINAKTAEYILKDMNTINESPSSWQGSLPVGYSIGPGFNRGNWRLLMVSYFISARFTSHDVAGHLRGIDEPDRYVIVSSSRRSLRKSKNFTDNANTLMEISKALANLRHSRKWVPTRTVVFLSTGLEGLEIYGNSWMQRHVDIIKYRTVAYLNIQSPISGLQCTVEVCPLLESLFSNLTLLMKNNTILRHSHVREMDKVKSSLYRDGKRMDESSSGRILLDERMEFNAHLWDESIEDTMSTYFGIPTINFRCTNNSSDDVVLPFVGIIDAEKYRTDLIRIWSSLTFTLTNRKILPFNFTMYSSKLENYGKTVTSFHKSHLYSSVQDNYDKFDHSSQNLTFAMESFQDDVHESNNSLSTNRTINEKLIQIQKLFICIFNTYNVMISHLNQTSVIAANVLENELNTGDICATEIDYFIRDPYY